VREAVRNLALASPTVARTSAARTALEKAVDTLTRTLGADRREWRWGRLHRSEFPHPLVSAYDLPGVERDGGGDTVASTGATFREIIDFSNLDDSRVTNTPGQSAQPGSPYYGNLREPWSRGQYFPLRYSRTAVEQAAAHTLVLKPAVVARGAADR